MTTTSTPSASIARHADAGIRAAPAPALRVEWAQTDDDVREAQRLRYQVFALEGGARIPQVPGAPRALDIDRFDAFCDHLLVRAGDGQVVGTYRVLSPDRARAAGGYYTESEFDLAPLAPLRASAVELGRSCVHRDWRMGGVILAMWSALADFMVQRGLDTMIGCTSISLAAGCLAAAALWQQLRHTSMADPRWRVRPLRGLPGADDTSLQGDGAAPHAVEAPPLLKGYLRCGARVLGPPAFDEAFNTADLPMMLRLDDLAPRYRRHLLARA